jgi:hypothetical protein
MLNIRSRYILLTEVAFRSNAFGHSLVHALWKLGPGLMWSSGQSSWLQIGDVLFPVKYELNLYMFCRRKQTASVVQWLEFLATDPEVRVRFPALPDFLRSSGSGTGFTQPREYNWGATWKQKCCGSGLEMREYGRRDPSRWPRVTLYPQKLALTCQASCGRTVGIVHSRTQVTDFF